MLRRRAGMAIGMTLAVLGASMLAGRGTPVSAIEPASAAGELVALTNISRTSNGLRSLLRDSRLNTVSVERSEDMIKRDYFSHQIPPHGTVVVDTTVTDMLEFLGVPFQTAGENIAFNNGFDFTTVQSAGTDFMNSPSHRRFVRNHELSQQ